MDINKIQSILESLPDQDIAKYAQAPSAQVPQVLAQMELQRRATLRQAAQMKSAPGMFAGGHVRRFDKGGLAAMQQSYGNRQAREEAILEEAKRKRSAAMQEPGGPAYALGNIISSGIAGLGNIKDAIVDNPVVRTISENFERNQALRDSRDANKRAEEALAQGPTAFQTGQDPAGVAQLADLDAKNAAYQDLMAQAGALPPVPGAQQAQPGPAPTARPAGPKPAESPLNKGLAAVAPAAEIDVNADPRMIKMEAALKQKGEVLTQGIAQEIAARKDAMVPVDEKKERNRQIYTALGQWGTALLLTRNYGVANATALQTLQKEMDSSEAKRKEFKKAALDLALAEIKGRMEVAGANVDQLKELNALGSSIKKEFLDEREQKRKDSDTASDIAYKDKLGDAAISNAASARISAERPRTGANQELTFEDALKLAEDQIKNDKLNSFKYKTPQARQQAVQSLALELYNKNLAVLGAIRGGAVPAYPGATSTPTNGMIDFNKLPK